MSNKEKYIEKECKTHGLTKFYLENRGYYRCMKCRVLNVKKRRQKVKQKLVEHFGGACQICGYSKCIQALQFHHINPEEKEYGISANGHTKAFNKTLKEAEKCILVCANCHAEIENKI